MLRFFAVLLVLLPVVLSLHVLMDCTQSKYGCCIDGDPTSPDADGPNKKGCGMKLCKDFPPSEGYCIFAKQDGKCQQGHYSVRNKMKQSCAFTCRLCKQPAPLPCERSPYGCCWDGKTTSKGPAKTPGIDCPSCRDTYRKLCPNLAKDCRNSFPVMRNFLRKSCHKTCRICA